MSSSHDEQPLTRRQLRELERQKPRKEREADAKAAEQAEAARKAESVPDATPAVTTRGTASRRALREQGPAEPVAAQPVAAEPVVDEAASAEPETSVEETESVEETIIPEVVSDDEAVDDSEPATRAEPVIDVVPLTDPVLVSVDDAQPAFADEGDDDAEHVEIVATTVDTDTGETVVEQMVIDEPVPASNEVPPAPTSAAPTGSTAEAAEPPLAPIFRSPTERAQPTGDQLPSSFDDLISVRNAAAKNSISTTSALVLPSVPGSNDVGTALDETGEVIITGSIDLPASFGAMGAPASGLESNDLDSLLERSEAEVAGSDVAPVSASRAISTNTSSTSLIAPPKRARANAPVVLAVTAAVLAVGVVGLLLAVFVFRVF